MRARTLPPCQGELLGVYRASHRQLLLYPGDQETGIHRDKERWKQRDRHRGRERHREQEIQREMAEIDRMRDKENERDSERC